MIARPTGNSQVTGMHSFVQNLKCMQWTFWDLHDMAELHLVIQS